MNQPNHQHYYVARAAVSRNLAQKAANPMIAAIHADLARRYEAIVAQLDGGDAVGGGAQPA